MLANRDLYRELEYIRSSMNRMVRAQNFDHRSLELFNLEYLDKNYKPITFDGFDSEHNFIKRFPEDSRAVIYLRDKHSKIFLGAFQVAMQDNLLILFKKFPNTLKLNHQDLIYEYLFQYISDRDEEGDVVYGFSNDASIVNFPRPSTLTIRDISYNTLNNGYKITKAVLKNLGYYTVYYQEGEKLAMCFVFNFIGGILFLPLIASWVGNNLSLMMITLFSPTFLLYLSGLAYHSYQDIE
jgi:hypothetical protein